MAKRKILTLTNISDEEKQWLLKKANEEGYTMSGFIRQMIKDGIRVEREKQDLQNA